MKNDWRNYWQMENHVIIASEKIIKISYELFTIS